MTMKNKRGRGSSTRRKIPSDVEISSSDEDDKQIESESDDPYANESAHEKRIRLTKKAISKALEEVGSDEEGYSVLRTRLREEASISKGRMSLPVADKLGDVCFDSVLFFRSHKRAVSCVCISEDGLFAFSGGKDSNVIKWNLKTLDKVLTLRGGKRASTYPYHTGPVLSIAISSDGKYLASSGMDESIIIWDPDSMTVRMKLRRHRAAVTAVAFRRHSHMLFSGDTSGRVCVWNMPLTEVLQDQGARTNIEILGLCGLTAERCVSCSGFGNPGICVWKVPEEVCVQYATKNPLETSVECVCAVDDEVFIGGSSTNKIYIWHSSRGSPVFIVSKAHPEPKMVDDESAKSVFRRPVANWVTAIAGLPGTDLFASGSSTGFVQFWRLLRGSNEEPQLFKGTSIPPTQNRSEVKLERLSGRSLSLYGFINCLAFTPDRQYLVVGLGQEHRFGKWEPRRETHPAVCLVPLNIPSR